MDQDEQTGLPQPQPKPVDSINLPVQQPDLAQEQSSSIEQADNLTPVSDPVPVSVPQDEAVPVDTASEPAEITPPMPMPENSFPVAEEMQSAPAETPVQTLEAGETTPFSQADEIPESLPVQNEVPDIPAEVPTEATSESFVPGVAETETPQVTEVQSTPQVTPLQPFPAEPTPPAPAFEPEISGWNNQAPAAPVQNDLYAAPQPEPRKFDIKRIALIVGGGLAGIGLIAAGIFFGYRLYLGSSNSRILNAAAKNIIKGKNMEINFKVGASGISVDGSLYVDKDQDMKFKLNNDLLPLEAIYIKKTDTIYMKETSYSYGENNSSKDTPQYTEGKNLSKAIAKYGLKDMGVDSLDPTKNYFSAKNIKYFKRLPDEKMNGQNLYKFELTSTDEDVKKATDEANNKIKQYFGGSITIKELKSKTTIWITKSDFGLFKVEGSTSAKYSYKVPDYSKCYSSSGSYSYSCDYNNLPQKEINQDLNFTWELNVKGGYKEDIALPSNAKIIESVDLENIQEESSARANDTKKKANLREIQVALETYYADNGKYPAKLSYLVPNYLKSIPSNPNNDETIYTPSSNFTKYTLKVKLQKPDTTQEDEKDGYYKVGVY